MRIINRCPRHQRLLTLWTHQIPSMGAKAIPVFHCHACTTDRAMAAIFGRKGGA